MSPRHDREAPGNGGLSPSFNRWQCQWCGTYKVVPSLARDCERRHEIENRKPLKSSA